MGLFSKLFGKPDKNKPKWDKFKSFLIIKKEPFLFDKLFQFKPSRYVIWKGGRVVQEGNTTTLINPIVYDDGSPSKQYKVHIEDKQLHAEITEDIYFDEFVTSNDRLQMVILPDKTSSGNIAISMLKRMIGSTRSEKEFSANCPFCCNIFLLDSVISKVTFSFSNPDKLIEFY